MGLFDNFLQQIATGDQIKDYKHASRLFVDNNYALSPKYNWLYHVFFDLNPSLTGLDQQTQMETGMLVKSADLPKFRVDSKTYNNYNRPTIAQSKARFEDIQIVFHDDQTNVARKLWYDYYNYYYRDMDNSYGDATGAINPIFTAPNKQVLGGRDQFNQFGYTPRIYNFSNQYINAIRLYSLHQKRFSEYTLINPVITSYRHGSLNASGDGTLESTMTISYETVLYASGFAQAARGGFANLHYDKSPSPLTPAGGGTNSFAGPGGILNAIDEVIQDGSGGNYGSAAFKLLRGYNKNKNVNLKNLVQAELTTALFDIASGRNPQDRTFIPYSGVNAGAPGAGSSVAYNGATTAAPGSASSNGSSVSSAGGVLTGLGLAAALSGEPTIGAGLVVAGIIANKLSSNANATSSNSTVSGGSVNTVANVTPSGGELVISAAEQIAPFSFAGFIAKAARESKARSAAEKKKKEEEAAKTADAYSTLYGSNYYKTGAGAPAYASTPTYETGTNTAVTEPNPLDQTPYKGTNTTTDTAVPYRYAAESSGQTSSGGFNGNQSTNPIPGVS
jgi:hypothetical protein